MRPLSFWQESEYLQNSGQAFLVRQESLVFIEHFVFDHLTWALPHIKCACLFRLGVLHAS